MLLMYCLLHNRALLVKAAVRETDSDLTLSLVSCVIKIFSIHLKTTQIQQNKCYFAVYTCMSNTSKLSILMRMVIDYNACIIIVIYTKHAKQ